MELSLEKQINGTDINEAKFVGTLVSDKWGRLYTKMNGYVTTHLEVKRQSNNIDIIPLKISSKVMDRENLVNLEGKEIYVEGKILTFNRQVGDHTKVIILVGVDHISEEVPEDLKTNNYVKLVGTLTKEPTFRQTPLKRYITELNLNNQTSYSLCSKIPCICWSKLAVNASDFKQGDKVEIVGRFQSRNYNKKLSDGTVISKVTYEVSAQDADII